MMFWIWLLIAASVAVFVGLIQYNYLFSRNSEKRKPWFALLRAVTVFCILLLLISPKFESKTYTSLRPQLVFMLDNSQSIGNESMDSVLRNDFQSLIANEELQAKFDISTYSFDDEIRALDSLNFQGLSTDLSLAINEPQALFKNRNTAIVVLSDGNQTLGPNYTYSNVDPKTHIYPVIYGDTTRYADLKVTQVNANRYSYLDNEYPVEVIVNYTGGASINTVLRVNSNGTTVYQQALQFTDANRSAIVNMQLKSRRVGLNKMTVTVEPVSNEKNTANNSRTFALEVIDQQSKILILSNLIHPDLAALKNAMESNKQRTVDLKKTSDTYDINDYNLVVLYGIDSAFAKAYSQLTELNKNYWLILGPKPNLNYLNSLSLGFRIENYPQFDDVQPVLNSNYSNFNLDALDFEDYPPVSSPFGELLAATSLETLMYKQIGAVQTTQPLWFTFEQDSRKVAVFNGSGLWRWRSQSYLDSQNFRNFDDLINSQVQFLASNERRQRLKVEAQPFYYENDKILIQAQYLNKNYEFVTDGILNMDLQNVATKERLTRPFVVSNASYQLDLSGLKAGDYNYSVTAQGETLRASGSFSILEFNIENQFEAADYQSMKTIATNNKVYTGKELASLKTDLLQDPLLQEIERSETVYQTLIDWQWLLIIILILLSLEWFLRKYNGLI